ncbi:MAG: TRAP transporter large permease subunit [Gammaproteobacteria bacterium]|nr:TRAP transporter large permease subunit [Gammaproteobacteria bacterium]
MELVFLTILVLLMVVALTSGFPVAFALPGSAIIAIALAAFSGHVVEGDVGAYFAQDGPIQWLSAGVTNFRSLYWDVERDTLIAIPLFIFMGIMLQRSRIAEDLLVAMAQLFGPVPSGLGISVVFVGALLAATTGIVGATVIAMGLISLPAMLRNNYSKSLATGTICASGTLGQIIPPSIVLIILADQLSSAADQASTIRKADFKEATGEFSMPSQLDITSASAGDMFMGALIPGLVLVGLYMAYILISALIKPEVAPPVPYDGKYDRHFIVKVLLSLVPPLTLIFVVLGSIILGVATVNQAGAIGAIGALVMGGYRLMEGKKHAYTPAILAVISTVTVIILLNVFDLNVKNIKNDSDLLGIILAVTAIGVLAFAIGWSALRAYRIDNTLHEVMVETAKTTSMVFIILIGAAMLTSAFRAFGGEELVKEFLTGLPGGFWTQFIVVMAVIFFLGFFLDFIEIAVVVVPIVAPILLADPQANITAVWLGVMIGLNIQTSFLTPPFGFALFYLRGVAPPEVKTTHIYKGAVAFIGLQIFGLVITGFFPSMVNYMPNKTFLTSETAPPPINPRLQICMEERVFAEYEQNESLIRSGITKVKQLDLSQLPEAYRIKLVDSFELADDTFNLVAEIQMTEQKLDEYILGYSDLHHEVRKIQRDVKKIQKELDITSTQYDRLVRKNDTKQSLLDSYEQRISRFEREITLLEDGIPAQWESAHQGYADLASRDSKARLAYRRNVDSAYEPLIEIVNTIESRGNLTTLEPGLAEIGSVIESLPPDQAMEKIKALESTFSDVVGVSHIKSKLSKARRKLKGNSPDVAASLAFYDEALDLYKQETKWRESAISILAPLSEYNQTIKSNIGLRLQERLNEEQAEDIASCLSVHRDVSLSF